MTHSITTLPAEFLTAIEILSLCTSMPIYLVLVIKGVPPLEWLSKHSNPTPQGASFYIASDYRRCEVTLHLSGFGVYQDLGAGGLSTRRSRRFGRIITAFLCCWTPDHRIARRRSEMYVRRTQSFETRGGPRVPRREANSQVQRRVILRRCGTELRKTQKHQRRT